MMIPYKCPYSHRQKNANFLMCKALMDYNKSNYEKVEDCVTAICAFGYYCPNTGRYECSADAKNNCSVKFNKDGE